MKASTALVILVGEKTKNLYMFVQWEIELALELDPYSACTPGGPSCMWAVAPF